MKQSFQLLMVLCFAVTMSFAQGENQGGFTFRAGISTSPPSSNSTNSSSIGFNVGGSIDIAATPSLSLSFSVDYNSIPFDEDKFLNDADLISQGFSVRADPASVITLFVSMRGYLCGDRTTPSGYITLGVGYFDFTMSNFRASYQQYVYQLGEIKLSGAAAQIGFGLEMPLGAGASFFVEGSLAGAFVQGQIIPFVPARSGLKVNV